MNSSGIYNGCVIPQGGTENTSINNSYSDSYSDSDSNSDEVNGIIEADILLEDGTNTGNLSPTLSKIIYYIGNMVS